MKKVKVLELQGISNGFEYMITINDMGIRCGYVGIPVSVPKSFIEDEIDVHGGITFIGDVGVEPVDGNIQLQSRVGIRFIGFDCGHCDDIFDNETSYRVFGKNIPKGLLNSSNSDIRQLRDVEFCKKECESICSQIKSYIDNKKKKKVKVKRVSDKCKANVKLDYDISTIMDTLTTPQSEKLPELLKEYESSMASEYLDKHYVILLSSNGNRSGFVEVPTFISNSVISNISTDSGVVFVSNEDINELIAKTCGTAQKQWLVFLTNITNIPENIELFKKYKASGVPKLEDIDEREKFAIQYYMDEFNEIHKQVSDYIKTSTVATSDSNCYSDGTFKRATLIDYGMNESYLDSVFSRLVDDTGEQSHITACDMIKNWANTLCDEDESECSHDCDCDCDECHHIDDTNMEEETESEEKSPKDYTYEIVEDGYYIHIHGIHTLEQRGQFSKPFIPDGSYEDNAKAQIEDLKKLDALQAPHEQIDAEDGTIQLNVVELFDGRSYEVEQFENLDRFSPEELQNLISLIFKNRGLVMRELVGLIKVDNDIDDLVITKVYEFIKHVLRGLGVDNLYNEDAGDCTSHLTTDCFRKFVIGTCIDTVNILNACIFNIQSFIIGGKNI